VTVGARGRQVVVVGRQYRREVAGSGWATMVSLHALAGTRGHGPSSAADKQALPLKLFPKFQNQHKLYNTNW
jgi:hypothetical protein